MEEAKNGQSQMKKSSIRYPENEFTEGYYPMSFMAPTNQKFQTAIYIQLNPELLEEILKNRTRLKIKTEPNDVYFSSFFQKYSKKSTKHNKFLQKIQKRISISCMLERKSTKGMLQRT